MNIEIADKLILGQKNIDRMRKEVKQVVEMIMGLAEDLHAFVGKERILVIEDETCKWEIISESHHLHKGGYWVDSWTKDPAFPYSLSRGVAGNDERFPELRNLQKVHASLSVFVSEMFKRFPDIAEKLNPVILAADAPK